MKKKTRPAPSTTSSDDKSLSANLLKNAVGGDRWTSSDNPTIFRPPTK